jgi:hypothetical protein
MQRVHNVLRDTAHAGEIGPLHLPGDFQPERADCRRQQQLHPRQRLLYYQALLSGSSMSQVAQEGQQDMLRLEKVKHAMYCGQTERPGRTSMLR